MRWPGINASAKQVGSDLPLQRKIHLTSIQLLVLLPTTFTETPAPVTEQKRKRSTESRPSDPRTPPPASKRVPSFASQSFEVSFGVLGEINEFLLFMLCYGGAVALQVVLSKGLSPKSRVMKGYEPRKLS